MCMQDIENHVLYKNKEFKPNKHIEINIKECNPSQNAECEQDSDTRNEFINNIKVKT